MPKPEREREHPSTYFVQDRESKEELNRLRILDRMTTVGMGGVLPEQSDPTAFGRVLDVGCGTGGWLIELAQTVPTCTRLVGVDVSRTYVEYARAQAAAAQVSDRVEFHAADALRRLEFKDHSFDLVNHRAAASWLRVWDWPKLLQEYRRVARPGGVVRITETEGTAISNSPALTRLNELSLTAFHRAGHFFSPTSGSVTGNLAHLLQQHGLEQVQTRESTLEYHVGTPEWQRFFDMIRLSFQTMRPFLQKWTRGPDDYEAIYQQMLREMQQPGFMATMGLLTAWGNTPSSYQPNGGYPR